MTKILLAAFNKKIAVELQGRLGTRNPDRLWAPQQRAVFSWFKDSMGHLVVRALAGTGKTTTIIEAVNYVPGAETEAKTLHSLGLGFIKRHWSNVNTNDEAQQVDIDRARKVCGAGAPDDIVMDVKKLAALCKNCLPLSDDVDEVMDLAEAHDFEPDSEWEEEGWTIERVAKLALAARDAAKERDPQGRISFDDMIYLPVALRLVRPWYDMVIIDEAQDMNAAQILLARGACKKTGRVVVVGDPNQAIYGFRGADSGSLDRLKMELRATELPLTVTYRCGKAIVALAQKFVPDFTAAPGNPEGVVDSLPGEEELFAAAKPGDFVLCRRNAPLMSTCLGFLRRGIPARVEGRDVAKGLKAVISKLRAKSVPDFIERVGGWLKKEIARAAKISAEEARQAKVDRMTDQAEALVALAEGCASVAEIGMRIETLFGDHGKGGPGQIVCSSVHRSKGLEADRVFILREEKKRPSKNGKEEANIEYVAITRARLHLTMVPLRARGEAGASKSAGSTSSPAPTSAPRAASRHMGTLGKRETFRLTVDRIFDTDGQWGTTHIHQMCDASGNVFKWFSTSEKLDAGVTYDVKGTVKSHETYRGEAQTVLTRCAATKVGGVVRSAS